MKAILTLSVVANLIMSANAAAQERPALSVSDIKFQQYMERTVRIACREVIKSVASDLTNGGIPIKYEMDHLEFESKEARGSIRCAGTGIEYKAYRIDANGQPAGPILANF